MVKRLNSSFRYKYKINCYSDILTSMLKFSLKHNKLPTQINIHPEHLATLRELLNIEYTKPFNYFKNIPLYVSERFYRPFCS